MWWQRCGVRSLLPALGPPSGSSAESAAVLIPARDEEENIERAVRAALRSGAVEVLVLDDGSTDRTPEIVRQIAADAPGLHLIPGENLPPGWCGKNFACAQLAAATAQPLLVFIDADLQLAPDSAPRLAAFLAQSGAQLASGVPRQITITFSEKLLLPLSHFLLLGFLPLDRVRRRLHPAYGAGCGQLFVANTAPIARRAVTARFAIGFAKAWPCRRNFASTVIGPISSMRTAVATCRMYRRNGEVWRGLLKNTHEGLGAPALIVPMTLLQSLGRVAPFVLLFIAKAPAVRLLADAAGLLAFLPRVAGLRRFRQPWFGVLLHPLGVLALLGIQWCGLARFWAGRPARWKGRTYLS